MKSVISTAAILAIVATPAVAQMISPTTFGGGSAVMLSSTKGHFKQEDKTAHTETDKGTVSTSTAQNDGKTPNGGVGEGGGEGGDTTGDEK